MLYSVVVLHGYIIHALVFIFVLFVNESFLRLNFDVNFQVVVNQL